MGCPAGFECTIRCGGSTTTVDNTCEDMTINARDSTSLTLYATGNQAFRGTQAYCPDGMMDQCVLYGNAADEAFREVDIYAAWGFSTKMHISCSGTDCISGAAM